MLDENRSLRVYTQRYSYQGTGRLDITQTGATEGRIFAPSKAILWPAIKARSEGRGEEIWPGYVEDYTAEMRVSYERHREQWDEILRRERVVLVCFCVDVDRCHRGILAGILEKLGATRMGEIKLDRQGSERMNLDARKERGRE